MSLSDTADRGIAGHLSESFNVVRKKQRLTSHASRSKGGFYTGMPAANHDDVVDLWKIHFYEKTCGTVSRETGPVSPPSKIEKRICSTWNISNE